MSAVLQEGHKDMTGKKQLLKAAQLYIGSDGITTMPVQQKLYARLCRLVDKMATKQGWQANRLLDAVISKAKAIGAIKPMPGKDY